MIKNSAPLHKETTLSLSEHCQAYKGANNRRAAVQLGITVVLFMVLIAGMIASYHAKLWWLDAVLLLPTAGLLVRLFIIQHDCGHGSYFASRQANDLVGCLISLLTVTPYDSWKRAHNIHHAASGNLDQRGAGGIDTLTVREYRALSWRKRLGYRLYRHPFILLLLGTPVFVLIVQRLPLATIAPFFESYSMVPAEKSRRSIMSLNAAMVFFYGALSFLLGWQIVVFILLPVIVLTSWIGGWLFFVQHQFEDTYWQRHADWDFRTAALGGSSYYVMPRILHWFTGNIGLHHIHHLCSAIPNYRLQECLRQSPELQQMNRLTIWQSLKCIRYTLWDENLQRMVGFSGR